jgi:hypothetical protein
MRIKTILTSTLILALATLQAQTKPATTKPIAKVDQCAELKMENANLKKSLGLQEAVASVTANEIEIKIKKIVGDKKSQIILIELVMTNKIENRNIEVKSEFEKKVKMVTLDGDVLFSNEITVPSESIYKIFLLNTETPIKCSFKFGPLLPTNEYLKLFEYNFIVTNIQTGKQSYEKVEFKDLKINWN